MNAKSLILTTLCMALFLVVGCSRNATVEALESAMVSDAAFQEALEQQKSGDLVGARESFGRIVAVQPTNSIARLHYAILLQDVPPVDPYAALANYEAYLVIAPDSDKVSLVNDRIQKARQQISKRFDESLIEDRENKINSYIVQIRELNNKISSLEKDVELGKKLLAQSEELRKEEVSRNKRLNYIIDTLSSGGVITKLPESPNANRTYIVKRGDTLWSIAREMYGDPNRNVDIEAANGIREGEKLVEGQRLIIP